MGSGASTAIKEPEGGWVNEEQAVAAGATDEQIKEFKKTIKGIEKIAAAEGTCVPPAVSIAAVQFAIYISRFSTASRFSTGYHRTVPADHFAAQITRLFFQVESATRFW